ncbi:mannose-1-phosphate guanylyltransferase [Synechocystis sp. PCC 7509]|uniref:mannose-1-phosphate guanylyltransferase n=1 Tax=Synechocystis sp. PCC 7509 TaxID=927677 RepID=UPI0002ACA8C1|nr:mannose-1-phosphate guanylyltransferase [Synechocystis sp. PCC 7509]
MTSSLIPVILAGGKGERFWPLSRKHRPKQFLSLDGSGKSLLQATAERLLPLADGWDKLWVVTSSALAEGVLEQLPQLPKENILAEPEGKDTAPAVTWTTLEIAKRYGEDAIVGFFPADPWIEDPLSFQQTLRSAIELAATQEAIATLGVKPTYPSTGYGYIEQGEQTGTFGGLPVYRVNRFTEKPDRQSAESFIATGRFSWNSGMFIFKAGVVINELYTHAPEIIKPIAAQGAAAYANLPKISIDYALMEKTKLAYVLPVDFAWDDLGDWNAIERLLKTDAPNVEVASHVGLDTTGSLLYSTDENEVIVTIGLEDLVIVRDRNVTLIVKKDRTQEIKQVLKKLESDPKFRDLL